MRIHDLDASNERWFRAIVARSPPSYFFFLYDLSENPERTSVKLAFEGELLRGAMLIFEDLIVSIRGDRKAARFLIDELSSRSIEIQVQEDHEDLVRRRYAPVLRKRILFMVSDVKSGSEHGSSMEPVALGIESAKDISALMRRANPTFWGDFTTPIAEKSFQRLQWYGYVKDGGLACIGSVRTYPYGAHIGIVATREDCRNQGMATAMVSFLSRLSARIAPFTVLVVERDNAPAIRAYSKAGFRPYQQFVFIRGGKRSSE